MKPDIKKPRIKPHIEKLIKKHRSSPDDNNDGAARITNETVAANREEVLKSARKYIYPLQHSKHRIVKASIGLFVVAIIGFFIFCGLALYKFQSTSSFIYGVTRVVPFPVAKVGSQLVSYDSYLFELRRYMHYYQSQQNVNFATDAGKKQLAALKQQSMEQVIQDALVKQLAAKNNLSVSQSEVNNAIDLVKSQNRLGGGSSAFQDVLKEFWGWSISDFKRELRQELLAQKVVDKLDTATHNRANTALAQLQQGTDFAVVAKQTSDDALTRDNGGEYNTLITKSSRDVTPQAIAELYTLKAGQYSGVINTGYSLEILKVIEVQGDNLRAAHIVFNLQPIKTYTDPLLKQHKPYQYMGV